MAKKLNSSTASKASRGKTDGAVPAHNAGVRADIQRVGFKDLWELDAEIKAAVEKHVAPLRAERRDRWATLRNDLGAKAADLNPLYALYKRDQELQDLDDEELAQESQDILREGFNNLARGETLNFLTVFGGESQPKQEEEPITTKTARAAGRETGRAGKSATLNPHGRGSDLHAAWAEGWQEGMADNLPCKAEADDGPFVTARH